MNGREFYRRIQEDEHLEWLGIKQGSRPSEDVALISHDGFGSWQTAKFSVVVSALVDHSWDELWAVLTGKRAAKIMTHMTRIVGYYSKLSNWNKSKLAELRDRHRGTYDVPDSAFKGDGNVEATCATSEAAASTGTPAGV